MATITFKQKIVYKNIIYIPNLNLMLFLFDLLYSYVFNILWNTKERNMKSKLKLELHCI